MSGEPVQVGHQQVADDQVERWRAGQPQPVRRRSLAVTTRRPCWRRRLATMSRASAGSSSMASTVMSVAAQRRHQAVPDQPGQQRVAVDRFDEVVDGAEGEPDLVLVDDA